MGALALILRALPTVLPLAVTAVRFVEQLRGRGNGAQKRKDVVEFVKTAILAAEGLTARDIVDEVQFSEGVGSIVDGVVAVLNSTRQNGSGSFAALSASESIDGSITIGR